MTPLIAMLGPIWLLISILKGRILRIPFRELAFAFGIVTYILLVTIFNLFVYQERLDSFDVVIRQGGSLAVGVALYIFFRGYTHDVTKIFYWIRFSFIVLIPYIAYEIVIFFLEGTRVKITFSEPSHLGHYLVFMVIPSIFLTPSANYIKYLLLSFVLVGLLCTVSLTGLFQAFILAMVFVLRSNWITGAVITIFVGFFGIIIYTFYQDSYLVSNLMNFVSYDNFSRGLATSGSLVDRFYSFYVPTTNLGSNLSLFGNGLGSDVAYYVSLIPSESRHLYDGSRNSIASFYGKAVFYGGLPLLVFLSFWIGRLYRRASSDVRLFSVPVFVAAFYSLGAMQSPYIWFWLCILKFSGRKQSNYD